MKTVNQKEIANTLSQVFFSQDGDIENEMTYTVKVWTKEALDCKLNVQSALKMVERIFSENKNEADEQNDLKELSVIIKALESHLAILNPVYKILEIVEMDKGFAIKTTFKMKKMLKKAIPSAKWNSNLKMWTVGSRSLKKLEAFVEQAKGEFNVDELKSFEEKKKDSKAIKGHTYDHKEILKSKYNAYFDNGQWFVASDSFNAAQEEIDALNEIRKQEKAEAKKEKHDTKNISELSGNDTDDVCQALTQAKQNIVDGDYLNKEDDFYIFIQKNTDEFIDFKKLKQAISDVEAHIFNMSDACIEHIFHLPNEIEEATEKFKLNANWSADIKKILTFFKLKEKGVNEIKIKNVEMGFNAVEHTTVLN